jgi:hypothetical protein
VFTEAELGRITNFLSSTFYRNFQLYACVFAGMKRNVLSHVSSIALETPVPPRPLANATEIEPVQEAEAPRAPGQAAGGEEGEGKTATAAPQVAAALMPVVDFRVFAALEETVAAAKAKDGARQEELAALKARLADSQ